MSSQSPQSPPSRHRYQVQRFLKREVYTLYENCLILRGEAVFGNNYEIVYRLPDLDSLPIRVWVRSRFIVGIAGFVGIGTPFVIPMLSYHWLHLSMPALGLILGLCLVLSLLLVLFNPIRIEQATFTYLDHTAAFTVLSTWRSKDEYLASIRILVPAISDAQTRLAALTDPVPGSTDGA